MAAHQENKSEGDYKLDQKSSMVQQEDQVTELTTDRGLDETPMQRSELN